MSMGYSLRRYWFLPVNGKGAASCGGYDQSLCLATCFQSVREEILYRPTNRVQVIKEFILGFCLKERFINLGIGLCC